MTHPDTGAVDTSAEDAIADARAAVAALEAAIKGIPDPVVRARAAGALLDAIPRAHSHVRQAREDAVLELRSQGLSWAQIGQMIRVHRSRARQIALGQGSGRDVAAER